MDAAQLQGLKDKMNIRSQKDFAAGALYLVVGTGFAVLSNSYRVGTAASMGPGYFPFWLGVLLALIGAGVMLTAMRKDAGPADRLGGVDLRSLLPVLLAVTLFGLLLKPLGLAASVALTTLVSSLADRGFRWASALLNAAVMVVISIAVFKMGLGLQFEILPAFLTD
ncbi:tripartite tricarboxylate transporter TctB family protein [Arvimicrobium flavum]|uniref:tripartite tricarboxylate transporter TctB family protein n=1 Tax=Arvimicrobium flavum TaxID=3393320 RepID=UPI00237B3D66|nr:tripartite tricarboxylate transporter TctB family protein [Mesorhizobium shangrilense]